VRLKNIRKGFFKRNRQESFKRLTLRIERKLRNLKERHWPGNNRRKTKERRSKENYKHKSSSRALIKRLQNRDQKVLTSTK
jgi:hypothetical protein